MSTVALIAVTRDNVRDVCKLGLGPRQDKLVAPAAYTVAEAHYYAASGSLLRAIALDGRVVGVLWVLTADPGGDVPYMVRFMVDHDHQGQGIGARAVEVLVDELRAAGHAALELSFVPIEGGAEGFWRRCGFAPTGREHAGETIVRRAL